MFSFFLRMETGEEEGNMDTIQRRRTPSSSSASTTTLFSRTSATVFLPLFPSELPYPPSIFSSSRHSSHYHPSPLTPPSNCPICISLPLLFIPKELTNTSQNHSNPHLTLYRSQQQSQSSQCSGSTKGKDLQYPLFSSLREYDVRV